MTLQSEKKKRQPRKLPKVLFIVGATASGKTGLGIALAKLFQGEIINADARQVYSKVNIGTGKPVGERGLYRHHRAFLHKEVPHYLMGFLPPEESYTAPQWRESALKAVQGITKREHLPIVVGGTGLYISSITNNLQFPAVEPHPVLREAYETKSLEDLVALLRVLDPESPSIVDVHNKRRVIRALEIMTFTGQKLTDIRKKGEPIVDALQIGIDRSLDELVDRASETVDSMIASGLIDEVRALLKSGVSENSPAFTSIGYRDIANYLHGKVTLQQAISSLKKLTRDYIRRQRTWFKRDERIVWIKDEEEAIRLVKEWMGR